jgi:glycosyltransferase involved in cell wall biosynthesis
LLGVSLDEGFDLPLIEAAKHALPILARDIPVFREIAGDHAAWFSGTTAEDLASALESWIELWTVSVAGGRHCVAARYARG